MTHTTLARYRNLVANVANWPRYFTHKLARPDTPVRFTTRGRALRFDVPTRDLYLVFKEIFLSDFYGIQRLVRTLPPHPVVVDVGANAGYFSMLLLSKVPDARVHAFEPVPGNQRILEHNRALNAVLAPTLSLHGEAVTGNVTGSVDLFHEPGTPSAVTASLLGEFATRNTQTMQVPAVALDDALRRLGLQRVDLLKLDCEGSEYPIVYDSPRALWRCVRAIALEAHDLDSAQRNAAALSRFLASVGYACTSERAVNGCTSLFAVMAT